MTSGVRISLMTRMSGFSRSASVMACSKGGGMRRDFPLPDKGASARVEVLERAFQGDDVARLRGVDFFDQGSKSRRLAAASWPGNDDEPGTWLGQSAQIRVQVAGGEILDRARQQANRKGGAANGPEHVDAAARARHFK
jgi:hypothetical protein